jgi:hypothetical protein
LQEKTQTQVKLLTGRHELPAALRSAINRRAWTLSHAAYEEYRKRWPTIP